MSKSEAGQTFRGYAPWRMSKVTRPTFEAIEDVLKEYEDQLPLTARQIYYRLIGRGYFEKAQANYGRVCRILARARRAQALPFDVLRDDGISVAEAEAYEGIGEFHDETARRINRYRRDRQAGQRYRVEVWCESAGMIPQLYRVAARYSAPVYSAGGFSSLTGVKALANRAVGINVPLVVLHVGDYDPSGEAIFEQFEDANAFVEADRILTRSRIIGHRVALTREQVIEFDLPTGGVNGNDTRSAGFADTFTCEAEALPPDVLAELLEDAIRSYLDADRFAAELEAEQRDRAELLQLGPGELK